MRLETLVLIICFFVCFDLTAQNRPTYFDGPYISQLADSISVLWIERGKIKRNRLKFEGEYHFAVDSLPSVHISSESNDQEGFKRYTNVSKFAAISDVHGQHDLFIKLLQAHDIINQDETWSYGDGHLIVVGDIMDRGDKVTESLWFLYHLEKQAKAAGGRVHMLLGNHELMVMHGNLGYVNKKYRYTSGLSQIEYPDFFSEHTILGSWLRSKNIVAVINNIGFVHGGFSPKVLAKEHSLEKINTIFKNDVVPDPFIPNDSSQISSLLYFENGPLWYRGYADPNGFDVNTADNILRQLKLEKIVVGHTSMPSITSVSNNKILLIDSSIQFGKSGEILLYQTETLYRGLLNGGKEIINTASPKNLSLHEFLYQIDESDLGFIIDTDLKALTGENRLNETYQKAELAILNKDRIIHKWDTRLRTRGNARKKVCHLPPLKIKIGDTTMQEHGFEGNNAIKLVLPCGSDFDQQALFKEYTIYKLYEQIDPYAVQTHVVDINLQDDGKEKYQVSGFLIEDEDEYMRRTNTRILTTGTVVDAGLERSSYLKMMFFQFMILNTDFAVRNKHNLELISISGEERMRAVPYDFDCSGMVDQSYAVPHESFPIDDVRQRYFRGKDLSRDEVKQMKSYFLSKNSAFKEIINKSVYLSAASKKSMIRDIDQFYKVLTNETKWRSNFKLKKR